MRKLHIENAIGNGGTPLEILEIMEIAPVLGIRAATSAVPIAQGDRSSGVALPDDKS